MDSYKCSLAISFSFSESLDELVVLALELFSSIEDKRVPVASFPEHPYSENELQVKHTNTPILTDCLGHLPVGIGNECTKYGTSIGPSLVSIMLQ